MKPKRSIKIKKMPKSSQNRKMLKDPKDTQLKRSSSEANQTEDEIQFHSNKKIKLSVPEKSSILTSERSTIINPRKSLHIKTGKLSFKKNRKSSLLDRITLTAQGKPNWKSLKREALELKKERKEKRQTNYDIINEAKKIWERVRREDCPTGKKAEYIVSLHCLVKDHLNELVFAHDTSRIIQWLLKLGSPAMRASMCESLKPFLIEMMQRKFSSFCIRNIFKYGDKTSISNVIDILRGNVMKLISNNVAGPLLESAYSQHASAVQKKSMEEEFFGRSWQITIGPEVKSLKEAVSTSTENKSFILKDTKENIVRIIEKSNVSFSILHSVIIQYFGVCCEEDKEEILMLLCPYILDLAATKAGSRIGMQCVWFSPKKTKKNLIRLLKGHVSQVCMMEEGHWIILALLDSVDDTVLLNKVIVAEIVNNATTIITNENGRKVVMYLVAHRDTTHFHPSVIAELKQGDCSSTTLKNMDVKRAEILLPTVSALLQSITAEINVWMKDAKVAMVTLAVLKKGTGNNLNIALDAVAKYICSDAQIEDLPIIENAGINFILKKLLKYDDSRQKVEEMFSFYLTKTLDEVTLRKWITCNRGCFLLTGILEAKQERPCGSLLTKLNIKLRKQIENQENTGAKVLNRVLASLET